MKSLITASLINGWLMPSGQYTEIVNITSYNEQYYKKCSAVVIGPHKILTAEHCLFENKVTRFEHSGWSYDGECKTHDYLDLAVCHFDDRIPGPYASVSRNAPSRGDYVMLTGYGCIDMESWPDYKLRYGYAPVTRFYKDEFLTESSTALCFGDSGGPAYHYGTHEVIGINSKGDIKTRSVMVSLWYEEVRNWVEHSTFSQHRLSFEPQSPDTQD